MKKLLSVSLAGVLSLGISMSANAVSQEDAIEYRQAVMEVIAWNFGQMGAVMKGKIRFDAQAFAKRAGNVAFLSQLSLEGFIFGSYEGETDARQAIERNWDHFKAKMAQFQEESAKLAEVAKTAKTRREVGLQFLKTAKTCKGCHRRYKRR
jgi:cytochrome c556